MTMLFTKYADHTGARGAVVGTLYAHRISYEDLDAYSKSTGYFDDGHNFSYCGVAPNIGEYLVKYGTSTSKRVVLVGAARMIQMTNPKNIALSREMQA